MTRHGGELCTEPGGKEPWTDRHSLQLMSTHYHKNMLNMMIRTKIWTPRTMWDLICLDEGGPPTGWPRGQNHNSWGRNSSGLVQGEPHKGERWTRKPLLPDFGSNSTPNDWFTGLQTTWAHSRHSLLRQWCPGEFTEDRCPPHNPSGRRGEGAASETEQEIFDIIVLFPTSRLAAVWTPVNHSVWEPARLIHLKAARTLFRLWCWTRKNNPRPRRLCSLKFQGQVIWTMAHSSAVPP